MKIYIKGISYHLPEGILTNQELVESFPEWNAEKVANKVGIHQRHIAAENETAGDLALIAAQNLFREYNISPDCIDFILFCTQSPDHYLPTTACLLQKKLHIPTSAGALDYNLGCSGYVYGLSLAKGLVCSGISKNVLLLTGETYSKYIHPLDKGNKSLFGDAATATLVSNDGFLEIGNFALGTDGSGADNLRVYTGCSRHRQMKNDIGIDEGGSIISSDYLYMNGSEIFNFTLEAVPSLLLQILQNNSLTRVEEVDYFIFHQANKFMLNPLRKVCGIPKEKFCINMENTGNTVSSTIPIAIKESIKSGIILKSSKVLITGFGVGYSWGGCILNFK